MDWLSFTAEEACFSNQLRWVPALAAYLQVPELTRAAERGIADFTQFADLVIPYEGECVVVGKLDREFPLA